MTRGFLETRSNGESGWQRFVVGWSLAKTGQQRNRIDDAPHVKGSFVHLWHDSNSLGKRDASMWVVRLVVDPSTVSRKMQSISFLLPSCQVDSVCEKTTPLRFGRKRNVLMLIFVTLCGRRRLVHWYLLLISLDPNIFRHSVSCCSRRRAGQNRLVLRVLVCLPRFSRTDQEADIIDACESLYNTKRLLKNKSLHYWFFSFVILPWYSRSPIDN
jgi:hypothetical protein